MDFTPTASIHTVPSRAVHQARICSHTGPHTCKALGSSDNIGTQPITSHLISDSASATAGAIDRVMGDKVTKNPSKSAVLKDTRHGAGDWKFFGTSVNQNLKVDEVVENMKSGRLMVVNSRRRNGLIVLREFHAEFAGPGAAIGGGLDDGVVDIIPIGDLSLLEPNSHEEHQNAIKIRLQWIRLTQNFTDQPSPDDRARMILEQFKTYFDQDTVNTVPDEAFALLVGVFPQTIHRVRSGFVW